MPDQRYLSLVHEALALAGRHACPMCSATAWVVPGPSLEMPAAVEKVIAVACEECGFTHWFSVWYLGERIP